MSESVSRPTHDGGAAFPLSMTKVGDGMITTGMNAGMSLRDWFAGQIAAAIAGRLALNHPSHGSATINGPHDGHAAEAYAFADAMLKARESGRG